MAAAARLLPEVGNASSSVVETIGTFSLRTSSNCGTTFFSDELVHSTATSGFVALIAFFKSPAIFTPSFRPTPVTSPRSRPIFAGSMSTAPTIFRPLRAATCRTTAAPIGPRPTCNTLIGMLTPRRKTLLYWRLKIDPRYDKLPAVIFIEGLRRALRAWPMALLLTAFTALLTPALELRHRLAAADFGIGGFP